MQIAPGYRDVVAEISKFFRQQCACAIGLNIDPMAIAFDPGIGFGKTLEHNLELLAHLERLRVHDRALVVGVSRKSFLGKLIGSPEIRNRLIPGPVLTAMLRARGADVGVGEGLEKDLAANVGGVAGEDVPEVVRLAHPQHDESGARRKC